MLVSLKTFITTMIIDIIISKDYNMEKVSIMYSTKEAAAKLGLSQVQVRLLARTGVIKAKKVGRDWVVLDFNYTRRRRPKRSVK